MMANEYKTAISPTDLKRVRSMLDGRDPPIAHGNLSFAFVDDCWRAYDNGGSLGTEIACLSPITGSWTET